MEIEEMLNDKLLTRKETAKLLRVGISTLEQWAVQGKRNLKYIKLGRICYYKLSDIKKYILSLSE